LAWGNPVSLLNGSSTTEPQFRFVAGTSDGELKLYTKNENSFVSEVLEKYQGCIRDISWNPVISSNKEVFATCSERSVIVWVKKLDESWKAKDILPFPAPVWKVSWNSLGNALAISAADNITRVVRENNEENWKVVQLVNQKGDVEDLGLGFE
jgi:WD40 repeat protein